MMSKEKPVKPQGGRAAIHGKDVLKSCNLLNESCRNSLAHQLTAVTAEQITAACGMQPAQLLNQVGKLIAAIYPECDPALFTIYKRCGDYIKSKIL